MPDIQLILGIMAALVAAAGYIPYINAIFKKETKPNRASWFIWAVLGIITFASYYAAGARTTVWYTLPLGTLTVSALSLKYGTGGWHRFDSACILAAGAGLALWLISGNPLVALSMMVLIDFFAYLPTIRKARIDPSSENKPAWELFALSGVLNFLAIDQWTIEVAAYPLAMMALNIFVYALLVWETRTIKKKE